MAADIFVLREQKSSVNRSKVKFIWKYTDELKITIDMVEKAIEKELSKHFKIGSILSWNNNLKIRINDPELWIQRIVNCMFRYSVNDAAYGNTIIDLASCELSKRPRLHPVWKFRILDREKIIEKILKDLIVGIKEIY